MQLRAADYAGRSLAAVRTSTERITYRWFKPQVLCVQYSKCKLHSISIFTKNIVCQVQKVQAGLDFNIHEKYCVSSTASASWPRFQYSRKILCVKYSKCKLDSISIFTKNILCQVQQVQAGLDFNIHEKYCVKYSKCKLDSISIFTKNIVCQVQQVQAGLDFNIHEKYCLSSTASASWTRFQNSRKILCVNYRKCKLDSISIFTKNIVCQLQKVQAGLDFNSHEKYCLSSTASASWTRFQQSRKILCQVQQVQAGLDFKSRKILCVKYRKCKLDSISTVTKNIVCQVQQVQAGLDFNSHEKYVLERHIITSSSSHHHYSCNDDICVDEM
jgi:predicted transposase YbfD/YdcC